MILKNLSKIVPSLRPVSIARKLFEPVVKSGLSVTPKQMLELSKHGIPVSMGNASDFYDGSSKPSFDMDLENLRGIDVATLWEEQQRVKQKMRSGSLKDRKIFASSDGTSVSK